MAPKRPTGGSAVADPGSGRKKRKVMTLAEKIKVLNDLESGLSLAEVGRRHGVNESTVRGIRKVKDNIRVSVRATTDINAKVSCVSRREPKIEKMEFVLSQWIWHQTSKGGDVG